MAENNKSTHVGPCSVCIYNECPSLKAVYKNKPLPCASMGSMGDPIQAQWGLPYSSIVPHTLRGCTCAVRPVRNVCSEYPQNALIFTNIPEKNGP